MFVCDTSIHIRCFHHIVMFMILEQINDKGTGKTNYLSLYSRYCDLFISLEFSHTNIGIEKRNAIENDCIHYKESYLIRSSNALYIT